MARGTAIVTGAGTGIGKAVAHALLAEEWNVTFCGRRLDRLSVAIAESGVSAGRTLAKTCDVSNSAEVEELFAKTVETFGRVDLIFNNAGSSHPYAMIDEVPVDAWERIVSVNLTGAFLCAREAFRVMRNQRPMGGRIINNGSISAHAPRPGSVPYTTTKHAISGLTRSLALDGRAYSIACGQIDIGNAETDMTQRMSSGVRQPDGQMRPEPVMDVRNVAKGVAYMAGMSLDANVLFMTVMASGMPFVGRG